MRSTWVINMRRQQYRLHPSWSMASLPHRQRVSLQSTFAEANSPLGNTVLEELQVALPQVSDDLLSTLARTGGGETTRWRWGERALPQEKHRTGMIILLVVVVVAVVGLRT